MLKLRVSKWPYLQCPCVQNSLFRKKNVLQTSRYLRMISISIFAEFIKQTIFQYILGPRTKYIPLDILNMCRFYFGLSGNDCIQDPKTAQEVGRRRRPTSSAVFASFVQSFPGSPKSNIHILSISNGTYFFRGPIMY